MSHEELTYEELEARLARAEAVIEVLRGEQVDAIVGEKHLALVRLKEVEDALAESVEAHRRLMELSFDGVAIYREGEVVFANPALAGLLGAEDPEQLLGRDVKEFVSSEYREVLEDRLRQVRHQGEAPLFEERLVRLDGTAVDVEVAGVLTTYEGQPAVQVVIRDITAPKWAQEALSRYAQELAERVRQLNCLYGISALVEKPGVTLEEVLQGTVELLPPAWHYPEITCARLAVDGQEYRTDNYEETAWVQTADIVIRGERAGTLQVGLLEERPASDEGPFAQQEPLLIDAIAQRVGRIIERTRAEEALRQSTRELTLRNRIARVFLTTTDEEMYGEVLQVVLEALESEYGVFGYIDEDGALICASMTKDIWDKCQIPDKDIVFPRETWGGIWGRALVEAKSFYSNGPMRVPEGHVPIERAIAVPIIHQGEPIGILEAANKDTDYDERDQGLLEAIAGYIAPVLQAGFERDREERERRRAEEALRESEERFRTMYSQSPISVELYDADGKSVDANPACLDLFGVDSVEELRGFSLFEDPNMPSDARAHIERGEAVVYENVFDFDLVAREGLYKTSKSGSRFIDVRITPLKGAEGVPGGFLVHVQDITERKRAEEELRETTRLLETILDHSHVLVACMDPGFNFLRVNRAYAEADGRDSSFFPGRNHFDLYPDEENQAIFQSVAATGEVFAAYAKPFEYAEHPERGVSYWDWSLVPITEDDGTVTGLVLTVADVTERTRAEQALWESEEKYRDLVENIDDVIYAADAEGVVTYVSPSIEAFGYTLSEVIGHTFPEFLVPEDSRSAGETLSTLLVSGHSVGENEYRILSKSGEVRWIRVSSRPVFADDRVVGVRGVLSDITERKRAERQLLEAKEDAERARGLEGERRQEAERRRQIAESLADVMTVLNSNQSLDEVLDYIAMRTAELLGNQAVGIYRLEDDQKFAIQAARGLLVAYATGRDIPIGHAALRRAMASREAVPVPRLGRHPSAEGAATREALQETLARTWGDLYQALLAVPIIVGEELYGAIALYYSEAREFPEEEIELATVFGDQVALAIENARLREQVRETAAIEERERLARDLHDAVTQTLFSSSLIAEALPRVWERDPDRAREGLKELRSLTQGALAEMRTLLLELRPAGLTEKALGELLSHLTQAMTGRSRVPIRLTVEGDSHLPDELQIALYRIAQEALNNVARHAEANEVSVWLHCEQARSRLRIRDDGRGFDPEDTLPDQLGMGIMRERAKSVGATLKITSQPGQGTEVAVDWQEGNGRPSDD
ncbi:MAG: PAS domain S-box protein [Anaerolineae bacterium]|nr:PAS domain S-box protein [Anaerolineae bacterium]NIN96059.1 PAS domain S-box protein [Anaerolineae bacterium]NIQ79089.1 PAS domain S-box protein [Anaerolineae bacterium]